MAYAPTTWIEKATKVGPTNLNHLELGVQATAVVADAASVKVNALPKITTSLFSGGPPGAPSDGDIWVATAVDTGNLATTNGTRWTFQYNAASGSAFKWECIGGGWLTAIVDTLELTASAVLVDLATVGPQVTLARAGDYNVDWGAMISNQANSGGGNAALELFKNGVTDMGIGMITFDPNVSSAVNSGSRSRPITGFAAADTLRPKYAISNALSVGFSNRFLRVQPIRIA